MDRDPSVFCLGEDIGIYGGAFKVTDVSLTASARARHRHAHRRVAIVGAAFGASLTGMRPVAEFQFMDFIGLRLQPDQQHGRIDSLPLGRARSLVLRGPSGGYVHGGPFHSQNPEMWFVHNPGLKVICRPRLRRQSLIKAAIREQQSLHLFEHNISTAHQGRSPRGRLRRPIGKANIAREGRDLSIIHLLPRWFTRLEAAEF